jgi:hypothetical protein
MEPLNIAVFPWLASRRERSGSDHSGAACGPQVWVARRGAASRNRLLRMIVIAFNGLPARHLIHISTRGD